MDAPEYACAVIADLDERLLLELRPAGSLHACNELTCFGGRREAFETAEACLRRELREELDWIPSALKPVCDLIVGDRSIAQFFSCPWHPGPLRTEPGHVAVWIPRACLPGVPLSPWHRQVLAAIALGQSRCELPATQGGRSPQHTTNSRTGDACGLADSGSKRREW